MLFNPTPGPSPTSRRGEFRELSHDMTTESARDLPPPDLSGGLRGVKRATLSAS